MDRELTLAVFLYDIGKAATLDMIFYLISVYAELLAMACILSSLRCNEMMTINTSTVIMALTSFYEKVNAGRGVHFSLPFLVQLYITTEKREDHPVYRHFLVVSLSFPLNPLTDCRGM